MKYLATLSTCFYVWGEDNCLEWDNEQEYESRKLGLFDTFAEARNCAANNPYHQNGYFCSIIIETEADGEVWSSIPVRNQCKTCGHEEWERLEERIPE